MDAINWANLAAAITAIGTLGTAAFGLVDATKLVRGGVSSSGYCFIETVVKALTPPESGHEDSVSATSQHAILGSARANWLNGLALSDQKSAVKALIKLRLNPATASRLAHITGLDPEVLTSVARKLFNGDVMTQPELDSYGRFDLLLAMTLDRAYQSADQRYRNTAKLVAGMVAVLLAEIAAFAMRSVLFPASQTDALAAQALVVGLLATPLAPIAKDLSTSINNAATAVQAIRK